MRYVSWWLAGTALLTTLGCAGGGSTPLAPAAPTAGNTPNPVAALSASGSLGSPMIQGDIVTAAMAIYTVDIDPASLQATVSLKETRSGQQNDDLYLLSIDSFLGAGDFAVTGITGTAETVDLSYQVSHPFPAPSDPTGTPNGSTNRADLGVAGMVLFLADVPSATGNTYFTDKVANTELVANADAFYEPGGLLSVTGNSNTFPYRQLVDELADSRDVSNSGDVTGNFGSDGWTRSEFGAGNNGWTGYGVLHQGQTSRNVVSLDKDALAGGFSLDVSVIAVYNDPRGGTTGAQKKANRLPPAAADASLFAYRMPHGALDGASISFLGESGGFSPNTISASDLSFHVVDWDARATETTEADLSDDASFTNVSAGESGTPALEVCIPGVLGDATFVSPALAVVDDDTAAGGDAGADEGLPGDALYYAATVTKVAGSGQSAGAYTGMARVTDPQTGLTIGLDESLAPLPSAPEAVTYQAFPILMNNLPTATVALTSANPMNSGTSAAVSVTGMADLDGDNLDVLVDWGDGGGFQTVASGLVGPVYPPQAPTGPQMNNADLVVDSINLVVRISDGTSNVDFPLPYDLGANRAPVVSGTPALAAANVAPPATFSMNAGTGTAVDPEGDAITYLITAGTSPNGPFPSAAGQAAFPIGSLGPYPTPGVVAFTVHARDTLHGNTTPAQPDSTSTWPVVNGTVAVPCPAVGFTGTNLAGSMGFFNYAWQGINGSTVGPSDFAAWTQNNIGGTPFAGVTLTQIANGTSPNGYAIVAIAYGAATPVTTPSLFLASSFGVGYTRRVNQLEAGTDSRVFFSELNAAWINSTSGLTVAQNYDAAIGATTGFRWFNYTGTAATSSTAVTTSGRVIAMTLDDQNNVIYIDENHVMHRHLKSTGYAEDTAAPWPMNISSTIGTNTGTLDTNRKVADLVFSNQSQAFIVLVISQDNTATGNHRLYRFECDGAFNATLQGNPNPRRFAANTNTTQTAGYDITIDQTNTTGGSLGPQGDAQIFVCSYPGDTVGWRVFNSNLVPGVSGGPLGNCTGKLAIMNNHWFTTGYTNSQNHLTFQAGATYPTGWFTNHQ